MPATSLESRLAFIRDLAARGGFGATLAARDATLIIELALRELLRRHLGTLPADKQRQIEQAIQTATKGSRASGLADLTLGQLIGVIRDTAFFDAWSAATGQPLAALRLIDLNALTRFRNQALTHLGDWGQATDPASQVSPADAQFLLHCLDLIVTAFGILSLEDTPPTPDPALLARLPPLAASPYLGLRAFGAEQRDLFFGRERDTDQLLARVQSQPCVALVGNSGSGKSSLVAAGLLPRLPAEDWLTLSLQPRDDLIDRLAATLLPHLYPDPAEQAGHRADLSARLAEPDYRLDHLLEGLPDRGTRRVLLVVDQFEELFTLSADRQRQRRAVDLLLSALHATLHATLHTGATGPLRLLLVLRADFYGHLLDLAPLQQALDRWPPFNLGPMEPAALQDAIVKPAERAGLTLESGLAETIVRDLGDAPGHLPLLQTALDELWQRRDRQCLTHAGYRAIGGLSQALARKADDFLAGYNAAGREQLRRIFVQLVRPGEGAEDTRQLATRAQVGADNWGLVTLLATERLLVTGHDLAGHETVQLAHEALIRHWQQLRDWINEDRGFRLWQNKLRDSRADWASHGQDEGYLLRGLRLAEAREQLAERGDWLDGEERDYIAVSLDAQERERAEREAAARARRRAERRLLYGLAIGLAGALTLAGFAFWQRDRAERATAVATLARGQAEGLINYMLFDLRDKLTPIGRLDLLDGVARQAAAYFEQLPGERVSAESERNRGVALENVGNVRLAQGDLAGALAAYEARFAIAERLARQDPANAGWQRDLTVSHSKIGGVRQAQGDLAGALAAYEADLAITERLARQDPANAEWQRDLSVSHSQIGGVRQAQGDLAGALAAYEAYLAIAERLARQDPANAGWQRDLSISHNKIGEVRQAQGDLAGALAAYEAGLAIAERLARQDPANAEWQRDLSISHNQIGGVRQAQGDLAGALAAYEAGLAIAERLARQAPANAGWQRDLSSSHQNIGRVRQAQGDLAGALAAYEAGLAICERLARQDPANAEWQHNLALIQQDIGGVRQAQGDLAGALAAYEAALAIAERLARQDPANAQWQRDLSISHEKIGEVRQAQGDLAGALAAYEAQFAIAERLARQDPANAGWQRDLAVSHSKIGGVRQAQGDLAGALAAYEAWFAIAERLARQDPANAGWQRDLAVSHSKIGAVRQAQGDLAGALAAYEATLAITERLARQDPENAEWQRDLSISHNKIGGVREAQGDLAGARAAYAAMLAIMERLTQQDPANVQWQWDLSESHNEIGKILKAQGDLPKAREACETGLAIAERLAGQDPANAGWQRDLAVRHNGVGDVRQAQGDLAGARESYAASLAILEPLTRQDPTNAKWRDDLALVQRRLAEIEAQQKAHDTAGPAKKKTKASAPR